MANDLTESVNALKLARARWGPTGFQCPHCGHDRAYQLAPRRPRVFQCTRCRRQRSVTAGTAMHGTKLPLRVWMARGEWLELGQVPTSSGFATEHGVASSSAWHLNQRFMAALDLGQPQALDWAGYLLVDRLRCRRPKRLKDPGDLPEPVRDKTDRFLLQRLPLLNEVALGVGGHEIVLVDGCPSDSTLTRMKERPLELLVQLRNRGLERWLTSFLHRRFRSVCVRWMAQYVRHLLQIWSRMRLDVVKHAEWVGAVLAGPRRDLRALRAAAARVGPRSE